MTGSVRQLEPRPQQTASGSGGNGGSSLTNHRIAQMEGRMDAVEAKVDNLVQICTRIETTLQMFATKESVWKVMALGISMAVLTLVGHMVVRIWL